MINDNNLQESQTKRILILLKEQTYDLKQIKELIKNGENVNQRDENRTTILHFACKYGDFELTSFLLEVGADKNIEDFFGIKPIDYAIQNSYKKIIDLLCFNNDKSLEKFNYQNTIYESCQFGKKLLFYNSVKKGALINKKGFFGQSPIIFASVSNKINICKQMLKNQSNTNIEAIDDSNHSCFFNACLNDCKETIAYLMKFSINKEQISISHTTPLIASSINGFSKVSQLLLLRNISLESRDIYGRSALIYACQYNNIEIIELLLKRKIDIDSQDKSGKTSLIWASENGHNKVVELLIKYNANKDLKDKTGKTALDWATIQHNYEIIKQLKN